MLEKKIKSMKSWFHVNWYAYYDEMIIMKKICVFYGNLYNANHKLIVCTRYSCSID